MESSPSSRLRFFDDTGAVIACPIEGQRCGIDINIPGDFLSGTSLQLGTLSLPVRLDQTAYGPRMRSQWPPCGPGHYALSLRCGEFAESRSVAITPRQFSEDEYCRLMYELAVELPEATALSLLKCGGLLGMSLLPEDEATIEQEYFKLRASIMGSRERQGIVQFLPDIQRDCHQVLLTRHVLCAANKAKKPDTAGLVRALAIPGNISPYENLYNVYDSTVESSFNTYENRLVKAYIQALHGRLSRLQARLESAPSAFKDDVEALFGAFRLARSRAKFLKDVKTPFITLSHITMVLLKKPPYRAVLDGYLDLLKQTLVRLEEPALATPLNQFPFLYQLWGTLKTVKVVLEICGQSGFRSAGHPMLKRDKAGLFVQVVADGQPAVELSSRSTGTRVKLIPMKTGSTSTSTPSPIEQQHPFLAIEIATPGRQPGVILIDTKYKVPFDGAPMEVTEEMMKEDILQMLLSLNSTRTANEVPAVIYAAMLYPGRRATFSPQVEALPAHPSHGSDLENIIGAVLREALAV